MHRKANKIVANWIFLGVAMLIIQVLLGGVTRLTGSGLSITEWKPIMGFLPPLNEADWQQSFDKYKNIAQYKYIHHHFTLDDFKFIFFWEWFHRLWARVIAIAFAIPFIYFLIKKYIKPVMIRPLVILFLLGALQGAIGWIMVKSGLNDQDVYVSHIKLSIHFVSAMVLIVYALIVGLSLITQENTYLNYTTTSSFTKFTYCLIALLVVQLFYGAFMAGLKAANAAPTWPSINGDFLPINNKVSVVDFLFFNKISIHFIHRGLAYLLVALSIYWYIKAKTIKASSLFTTYKFLPIVVVISQVILGIVAVLISPKIVLGSFRSFEWVALIHQLTGMVLLLSFCGVIFIANREKA
ncbi:MAG: COX15/CtaA family protein [Chitinophagaceae bacterium]